MSFNEMAAAAADIQTTILGESLIYRGANGDVSIHGIIDRSQDLLSLEVPMSEPRWLIYLSRSEVSNPYRGDTVTQANGSIWELQEELPNESDEWMTVWSITSR